MEKVSFFFYFLFQNNYLGNNNDFFSFLRSNKPLQIWHTETSSQLEESHVSRVIDDDIKSTVIEIISPDIKSTYITCPSQLNRTLGIKLPILVFIVKNFKKYFTFEVQIMDDKNIKRIFRASNFQVHIYIYIYIFFLTF